MPTNCAVASCKNIASKDGKIHFYSFPKNEGLRNIWISCCSRRNKFNPHTSRICSDHFTESDFRNLIEHKMMDSKKLFINEDAIPTINLYGKNENSILSDITNATDQTLDEIERIYIKVDEDTDNEIIDDSVEDIDQTMDKYTSVITAQLDTAENVHQNLEINKLRNVVAEMGQQIALLRKQNADYKHEAEYNRQHINLLQKRLQYLKKKKLINANKDYVNAEVRKALSKIFTKNQINLLLKKRDRVCWSEEDISLALTIRYYSKQCYTFLKDKLHYPLPALSTLRKWEETI